MLAAAQARQTEVAATHAREAQAAQREQAARVDRAEERRHMSDLLRAAQARADDEAKARERERAERECALRSAPVDSLGALRHVAELKRAFNSLEQLSQSAPMHLVRVCQCVARRPPPYVFITPLGEPATSVLPVPRTAQLVGFPTRHCTFFSWSSSPMRLWLPSTCFQ